MTIHRTLVAAALALLLPATARAQLPNASAAGLALGENYTAVARGWAAVAWNPANLGMPGSPGFSLALLPTRGVAGLDPVGIAELNEFDGDTVPFSVRQEWLDMIREEGSQQGSAGFDISYFAFSVGRFGFQAATTAHGVMDLAPDAAEVVLFGNAGETGQLQDYDFGGSSVDFAMLSTLGLSYAHPLTLTLGPLPDQHFAVGATVKYIVSHFLLTGVDRGSQLTGDPLQIDLDFPVITIPAEEGEFDGIVGRGVGLDVGAAWQAGPFAAGATITNLINTFAWNEDELVYIAGSAVFDADTSLTEFEERPLEEAPQDVRDRLDDRRLTPVLAVGASFRPLPLLTLVADVRQQLGEGLELGPRSHIGVGAELRAIPFVPLRAGLTLVSGGYQVSGGIGLEVGPLTLNTAIAARESDVGGDTMFMVALGFGAR